MSAVGWLREWGPALVVGATLATVATVAGFISYTHICALTLVLHQSWKTAHLTPLAVDGQIVIGSAVLATVAGIQKYWGLLGVVPGLAESLFANWESGIAHGHTAAIWATVAAQAFAVSSFLFERWVKAQAARVAGVAAPNARANDSEGVLPEPDPCPHQLPSSADEAVITTFLHSRDCTGEPLSARQLSAAFGLNRLKVAELVKAALGDGAGPAADEVAASA